MDTIVEHTRSESAALSRAAAVSVQEFQDNLGKQHEEFEVTSFREHCKGCARGAQDAFDKSRVRLEETVMMAQGWTQRAEDSIEKTTEAIGKVMAMVVELERKIARVAAGGGGDGGDWGKKSFLPKPEHGSKRPEVLDIEKTVANILSLKTNHVDGT